MAASSTLQHLRGEMAQQALIRDKNKCIRVITLLLREYSPILKDALSKIELKGHAFESHLRRIKLLDYISTLSLHDVDFDTLTFLAEFLLVFTRSFFKVPGYEYKNIVTLSAIIDETLKGLFGDRNNGEKNKFFANKILKWIQSSKTVHKSAFKQNIFTTLVQQEQNTLILNNGNWVPRQSNCPVVKPVRRFSCGSRNNCQHLLADPRVNRRISLNSQPCKVLGTYNTLNNSPNFHRNNLNNKAVELQFETKITDSIPVSREDKKQVESSEVANVHSGGNTVSPSRESYRHSLNRRLTEAISSFYKVGSKDSVRKEPKHLEKASFIITRGQVLPGVQKPVQQSGLKDKETSENNASPNMSNNDSELTKIRKSMLKETDSIDHKQLDLAFLECLKEFEKPCTRQYLTSIKSFDMNIVSSVLQEYIKDFDKRRTKNDLGSVSLNETSAEKTEKTENNSSSTRILRSKKKMSLDDDLPVEETFSENEDNSDSSSSHEENCVKKMKNVTKEPIKSLHKGINLIKKASKKNSSGVGENTEECNINYESDSSINLLYSKEGQKEKKITNLNWLPSNSSEEELGSHSPTASNDEISEDSSQVSLNNKINNPSGRTRNSARKSKVYLSDGVKSKRKDSTNKKGMFLNTTDVEDAVNNTKKENLESRNQSIVDEDTESEIETLPQRRRSARIKTKDAVLDNESSKPKLKSKKQTLVSEEEVVSQYEQGNNENFDSSNDGIYSSTPGKISRENKTCQSHETESTLVKYKNKSGGMTKSAALKDSLDQRDSSENESEVVMEMEEANRPIDNCTQPSATVFTPLDLTKKDAGNKPILATHIFSKRSIIYTDPTVFGNPRKESVSSVSDIADDLAVDKAPNSIDDESTDQASTQDLGDVAVPSCIDDFTEKAPENTPEECSGSHPCELEENVVRNLRKPDHFDDVDEQFNSVLRSNYQEMGGQLNQLLDPYYQGSDPAIKIKGKNFIYDLEDRMGIKVCSKIVLNGESLFWTGCILSKDSFADLVNIHEPKLEEGMGVINGCGIRIGCFEVQQITSKVFKYLCRYPDCDFASCNTSLFVRHIEVFHDHCEFQSSCLICDFSTVSLIVAFEHLHSHFGPLESDTFYSNSGQRNVIMSKLLSFDPPHFQDIFSKLQRISPTLFLDPDQNSEDCTRAVRKGTSSLVTYKYLIDYYKCFGCKFSCNEFNLFKGHFLQHFMTDRQNEKALWQMCAFCGDEMDLFRKNHCLENHGMSMYQCPTCLYRGSSGVYVAIHKILSHEESDNRVIKLFNHPHSRPTKPNYHSIKPYVCFHKYCSFETCVISKYVEHLWSHTFRYLSCFECGARFLSANLLLQHLEIHSFTLLNCAFCPLTFQDIYTAIKHLVISHPSMPSNIIVRENFSSRSNKPKQQVDYYPLVHEVGETILLLDFGNWLSNRLTYKTCFLKDPKGIIKDTSYDIYLFCEEIDPLLYDNSYEVTVTVRPSEAYFNEVKDGYRTALMKQISILNTSSEATDQQSQKVTGDELNTSRSFHLKMEADLECIKDRLLERMKEEVFKECGLNNLESYRQQLVACIRKSYVKKIKSTNIESLTHLVANTKDGPPSDLVAWNSNNESISSCVPGENETQVKFDEGSIEKPLAGSISGEKDTADVNNSLTLDDINESDISTFTEIYDDIKSSSSSAVLQNARPNQSSHEETYKIICKIRDFFLKSCGVSLQEIVNRIRTADISNLQCWYCDSIHLTLSGLVEHSGSAHPTELLTFVTDSDISSCSEISHDAPFTMCSICSKLFELKGELLCHYLHHHQELKINYANLTKRFGCPYCRLCFESQSMATEHIAHKHGVSDSNRGSVGPKRFKAVNEEQQSYLLPPKVVFTSGLLSSSGQFIISEKLNSTELKHYIMTQQVEDVPSKGTEEPSVEGEKQENCPSPVLGLRTLETVPAEEKRAFARKSTAGKNSKSPLKVTGEKDSPSHPIHDKKTDDLSKLASDENIQGKNYSQNNNLSKPAKSGKRKVFCAKGKVPQTARKSTYCTMSVSQLASGNNQKIRKAVLPTTSMKQDVPSKLKLGTPQRMCKPRNKSKLNQPKIPADGNVPKNNLVQSSTATTTLENLHDEIDINGQRLRVYLTDLKFWF